ncbi:glycerol-3-phosphate 1-O-acyltransferase PlsY [Paludibaculum fermentans]|uniref:Glycerol-3-phosphate acyltransferase n=1 Tax=Paludibaculum fermentans TaxID=1473598 RepID=A0A7S7SLI7_PALFE|nr:glycerol-3-phosphate 1-O-acyltransferase PlsY [Paludibaculum fermentans]QOY88090.1 glycerol-3-phosphate 1-O-acyltransferase PlsY [Paludibaculum fermentans]
MTTPLLILLAAYLLGGVPFGYILVRLKTGQDVRSMGSGNIGATNVLRTSGRGIGILTLLLDIGKGWLSVWIMSHFTNGDLSWMAAAAVAVVLGHAFPIFLKFQGGKAVASFAGAALALAPAALLGVIIVFVLVVAVTRFISLGSILGAALFPLGVWLIYHPEWPVMLAVTFCGAFVVWRHKSNIQRLRAGTENVFRFGGKK